MYFPNKIGHFDQGWPAVSAEVLDSCDDRGILTTCRIADGPSEGCDESLAGPVLSDREPNIAIHSPNETKARLSLISCNPVG